MGFQGVTAHWIEVKDGKWKMRGAVIGFKALSGAHDKTSVGIQWDCWNVLELWIKKDRRSVDFCNFLTLAASDRHVSAIHCDFR
jgi:hypothetical protein